MTNRRLLETIVREYAAAGPTTRARLIESVARIFKNAGIDLKDRPPKN